MFAIVTTSVLDNTLPPLRFSHHTGFFAFFLDVCFFHKPSAADELRYDVTFTRKDDRTQDQKNSNAT